MAHVLDQSGVADKLFDAMRYLFGSIRGVIAIAVIVISTLFGACTGIIGASVVTMGLLSMPVMLKYGYDKRMACGAVTAGGTLGILIPPSIMLIVMGNQSKVSVGKLFAGIATPSEASGVDWIGIVMITFPIHAVPLSLTMNRPENPNLAP